MANLRFAAAKERRAACITGGARGLGRAAALRFAEEGRDIALIDLLEDEAQQTVADIEALGQRAIFVKTDITDEAQVHAAINQAAETFGRLDILVCCAGILGWEKPFLEQTAEQFAKVMQINVHGVYYAHQAAVPHMLKGGWGRCVTITSGARRGSPRGRSRSSSSRRSRDPAAAAGSRREAAHRSATSSRDRRAGGDDRGGCAGRASHRREGARPCSRRSPACS